MTTPHPESAVAHALTVVIPHYGDPKPTRSLLRQLSEQTVADGLRVIVSDDASPQPFELSDPELNATLERAGTRVEVVHREHNGGFGANVNSGLERVETPLALVLNSDLVLGPDVVRELVAVSLPWQPAVVAPRIEDYQGVYQWTGRHFPTVSHQAVEWLSPLARWRHTSRLHEAVGHDTRADTHTVVSVDWVFGAAMILPVEKVREIGGFDEGYFMNAEEVDLQLRLRALGVPSVVAGGVVVQHEGGGSSARDLRRTWLVDARAAYARKWGRPRALQFALTAATAVNFAVNTMRRVAGRDVAPLATARAELALIHPKLRAHGGNVR